MPEIEDILREVDALWAKYAATAQADAVLGTLLARTIHAAAEVERLSRAAGMGRVCRACGEDSGGGCCTATVARQADPLLLVANRLVGSRAVPQHRDFTSCCFLGARGCVLKLKPEVCESFDCGALLASLHPRRLGEVREARGRLFSAWAETRARLAVLMPTATSCA